MMERFNDILLRVTLAMLLLSVAISANDRPRAPIPRAPLPTGARPTNSTAEPPQQVVRAPVKTVYVVGSTTCYPCQQFKQKHGDGTAELKYVYCYMNQPKPEKFDVATWNELVKHNNSGRFLWPFFVVKLDDGEFVAVQARVE